MGRSEILRLIGFILYFPTITCAATWRVELDGTGDFTDIQPAVEAAAPGDTIRLGPGRFQELHPCVAPAWTEQTVVWVTKDDLVFLGSGVGVTIVGTPTYYGPTWGDPKTFCVTDGRNGVIRNMTIENIEQGVYWAGGRVEITDCAFRGRSISSVAVTLWTHGSKISGSSFDLAENSHGIAIGGPGSENVVEDCSFTGFATAVLAGNESTGTVVRRSTFFRPSVAFNGGYGGDGTMIECTIFGATESAVMVSLDFTIALDHVFIDGGTRGIVIFNAGRLHGTDVVIEGTTSEPVTLTACYPSSLNRSHILPAPGTFAVNCYSRGQTIVHDFSGNWWGEPGLYAASEAVWDGNDDPAISAYVRLEPVAGGEVPVETLSWGDLKASYR